MRILVLANCQGGALARLLELYFDAATIEVIAVHQLGERSRQHAAAVLARSFDWVLTQPVSDNYPFAAVRTQAIRERFGAKVLSWPNAYFRGYNPELQYLRTQGRHTTGPLGDYHVSTLVEAWENGQPAARAARLLADEDYNRQAFGKIAAQSLAELKKREESTDARLAPFIEEWFTRKRLFYSFNHPSNRVLYQLARQLADRMGLKQRYPYQNGLLPEQLAHICPPINPWLASQMTEARPQRRVHLGLSADETGIYRGNARAAEKLYSDAELATAFFDLYQRIELPRAADGRVREAPDIE